VEFVLVVSIALVFLFGMFEYGRFVFMLQVVNNAAREGARFAVVHTGDGTTKQQVIDEVTARMASRQSELAGFTVDVLNVDPSTGAQIANTQWNDATFGNAIEVRITGTYSPILPVFLRTSSSISIKASAMMSSEGN
jgi:Flp pilus assembly protein TadG